MDEFVIKTLGPCRFNSPLQRWQDPTGRKFHFRHEQERILIENRLTQIMPYQADLSSTPGLEIAGPRREIFFEPQQIGIGIVTCGGLCPGLNNVIRDLVLSAWHLYGVRRIIGFRYGYRGLADPELQIILTPTMVKDIHEQGGSILSSSRGEQTPARMVKTLVDSGISILFVIGGDGSMRGALAIAQEIERKSLKISVIGIPKTIDNDLRFMDQSGRVSQTKKLQFVFEITSNILRPPIVSDGNAITYILANTTANST